jgi:NAD-dependent dihydropyrimidine dehydrogenase PreA subunit
MTSDSNMEECRSDAPAAGEFHPVIDRNRCEGKAACVAVCPYDVFEVRKIDAQDVRALSFLGRIKSRVHGGMTAYAPNADACRACALCVRACPEDAITLTRGRGATRYR